ncbi:hypothetical protein E2C01_075115 [Portunus trituberculatus]|uniref:Uncharacterized protein n=1 Tax=Portunus trituberculatus TaxID=210409 RepID=A0A5B7IE80_PORTR|nr:hypothetical protein [Portunus trituberculatus]
MVYSRLAAAAPGDPLGSAIDPRRASPVPAPAKRALGEGGGRMVRSGREAWTGREVRVLDVGWRLWVWCEGGVMRRAGGFLPCRPRSVCGSERLASYLPQAADYIIRP